jgi:CO dehydrogenase maturation factor
MGRTEGPGCYCYANDLLKGFLEKLAGNYAYVLMDNEAGMEHISRRTTRNVNALLIVANPTSVSLRSAARIYDIVQGLKLNIDQSYLVLNRLNAASPTGNGPALDAHLAALESAGLPLLGEVPYDDQVATYSLEAKGVLDLPDDSPVFDAVEAILVKLGALSAGKTLSQMQ